MSSTKQHTAPHRIMLLGDTHANIRWTVSAIRQAAALRAELILQLGDFGFWPHYGRSTFLDQVETCLAQNGLLLWFIDGNHEDHVALGSAAQPACPAPISPHITYLGRGSRWDWAGVRWVAVGGATSVDRHRRRPDIDWFEQETMTPAQQQTIMDGGPADVVVAHDAPWGVPFLTGRYNLTLPPQSRGGWPADALEDSDEHMRRMRAVMDVVRPKVWFHGHHHVRYDDTVDTGFGPVAVHGLGMDGGPLSGGTLMVDGAGTLIV